jgi:PA domain
MKNNHLNRIKALFAVVAICGLGAVSANAAATITIVNGDAAGVGFNDSTAVAPVGGNTGVTLGQQRLNAFQAAANKWGATLTSTVTIRILSTFEPLTCTSTGAVLGSAGATEIFRDFPGGAIANTWYSKALASKLFGADLDPSTADIRARFNVNLGNPGCLDGVFWYLGLDNNHGTNVDLVTVLTHEFGHGLGFQTFTNGSTGVYQSGFPSVWDWYLKDTTANLNWAQMTSAQRKASAINSLKLVWTGAKVTAAASSVLSLGVPGVVVGGPAAGPVAGSYALGAASFGPLLSSPGVTGDIMPVSVANQTACNPLSAVDALAVKGNIALVVRGVCTFTIKVANAQAAGAIGVLVQDNVAGAPPPGLGGADPTITIPSGRVTLSDGNIIRSALASRSRTKSGVRGTLGVNLSQLAGADTNGLVQMFTPNPFQSGSSVSHYDTGAFPNQLMEPAINGDLTHEVTPPQDLTYLLLLDIGW